MTFTNTTKIALITSILLLPIAVSNAYADGSAEIAAVCGFTTPSDVPLGMIVYGMDSDQVPFSIDVDGNGVGTLELEASDWLSPENQGNHAEALATTNNLEANGQIIIQGVAFTARDNAMVGPQIIDIRDKDNNEIADEVVAKINAHGSLNNLVHAERAGDWSFRIIANEPGTVGNNISISWTAGYTINEFHGGTDEFSVLPAETTRYLATTDGSYVANSYQEKTPLAPEGQSKVLTTEAHRENPINLAFQLTGVGVLDDVDYTGVIQQTWLFSYYCTE